MKTRKRITIHGIVQGVGFRPYIHKKVKHYKLKGWICNTEQGVEMEVEGEQDAICIFLKNIKNDIPPLAIIEKIITDDLSLIGYTDFKIKKSKSNHLNPMALIPPDISICEDCYNELINPSDRRYNYPFINCTNCGPRFTIINELPYDREKTTMKSFSMCSDCQSEYNNIDNRRYHAQPNACFTCGPQVSLYLSGKKVRLAEPIKEAQKMLMKGQVGAIKGLGGFHLTCDASNYSAVSRLREIKKRDKKPFAVMAVNIDTIKNICYLTERAEQLLRSKEKPILLLKKRGIFNLSEDIAADNAYLGVMLPYTPLHVLLLKGSELVLVMTSANFSDEPIIIKNEDALQKLADKVDFILMHNRPIYNRCDDSVIKDSVSNPIMIRRSRGYAPFPVILKKEVCQVLAVGPEEKNTVCFTRNHYAFPTQHLGDLKNQESFEAYQEAIERFIHVFRFDPKVIACDLHPDYLSTAFAENLSRRKCLPLHKIQHHYAHIASCMAENNLTDEVIGVAFDGTGLGDDGNIWGGEFMVADFQNYKRVGHLKYQSMPGGEQVIHQPWRMAYSYLYSIFKNRIADYGLSFLQKRESREITLLEQMINKKINSPLTSSCGRLFDAVSALIGLKSEVSFEGQAAIQLESICRPEYKESYSFRIKGKSGKWIIDVDDMFKEIIYDLKIDENRNKIASKFHNTVADFIVLMCAKIRDLKNINQVVLSGGVFQNSFLLEQTIRKLKENMFKVSIHKIMPPNDACISLGQAMIAGMKEDFTK